MTPPTLGIAPHLEHVQKFARLTRGEEGKGDRIANADGYAFRFGLSDPWAAEELVRHLTHSETQYSLLTGLPPTSLRRMRQELRAGMRASAR